VEELQRRLGELRYWVGPVDGTYGMLTEQAVYGFQKVNGLVVDGVTGPQVRAALENPRAPTPQSSSGTVWEVDKGRQILMLARDGQVTWVWNTSTGTEQPYTFEGRELLADTPPGHFETTWQVDGWRDGALGRMWRPKYFHPDGIAIHRYHNVPPVPASHGCVRVTLAAMDAIWAQGLAPVGSAVWVYGTTPT
jgi:lipoprotein-anchoring transpeptidase ErfK/SrfK